MQTKACRRLRCRGCSRPQRLLPQCPTEGGQPPGPSTAGQHVIPRVQRGAVQRMRPKARRDTCPSGARHPAAAQSGRRATPAGPLAPGRPVCGQKNHKSRRSLIYMEKLDESAHHRATDRATTRRPPRSVQKTLDRQALAKADFSRTRFMNGIKTTWLDAQGAFRLLFPYPVHERD